MEFFKKGLTFAVIFMMPCTLFASDLVNVNWLKANLNQIKIIDLRSSEHFESGHIPQSINIPLNRFTRKKNNIDGFVETPVAFKAVMEEYGISNSDIVVLYSDWSFLDSMRTYWVMDFYGHKNTKVLDGGLQAWVDASQELNMAEMPVEKSQYVIEINSDVITTKFRTFMASKNPNYVIVDGRDNSQFKGEKSLTSRKGHIPNAINLPWVELVTNRTENDYYDHIKSPATLQDINTLKEKLSIIPKDKKIILYCNGGQESSVLYFALKELGMKASVYDGSWFEWSGDNNLPVSLAVSNNL